jgi:hypothetical protein
MQHRPTSSQVSACGHMLCGLRGGRTTCLYGQALALVSPLATRVSAAASTTHAISGLRGSSSSKSADLQSSLESRLRARTALLGSTLFTLTWKARVTPSQRRICALRASVRHTSDSACTSWPTPMAADSTGSAYTYGSADHSKIRLKLPGAALLASWGTPTARTFGGTPEQHLERKRLAGITPTVTVLHLQAELAAGVTPTARDWKDGASDGAVDTNGLLGRVAWLAQREGTGEDVTGSLVATGNGGRLNPAHSRWLMGLPPEWDACVPTETPSRRRARRNSSAP